MTDMDRILKEFDRLRDGMKNEFGEVKVEIKGLREDVVANNIALTEHNGTIGHLHHEVKQQRKQLEKNCERLDNHEQRLVRSETGAEFSSKTIGDLEEESANTMTLIWDIAKVVLPLAAFIGIIADILLSGAP